MTVLKIAAENIRDLLHTVRRINDPLKRWTAALCALTLLGTPWSRAAVPQLLRTAGFEAPVHGDPDDLLTLPGWGFESGDRVVYQQVVSTNRPSGHPAAVPVQSTAILGTALIIQAGPYALTVRLPSVMQSQRVYLLWVVSPAGAWSEPASINDARPFWITPALVQATADDSDLGRRIRVVGRNLAPDPGGSTRIRLVGPSAYELTPASVDHDETLNSYLAEGMLPARLTPGMYSVSVNRDGQGWTQVPGQRLEVRSDTGALETFTMGDPRFGDCAPNDGRDDGGCLGQAIDAAHTPGRGIVVVPAGTWDIYVGSGGKPGGFQLPPNVRLRGETAKQSILMRHGARQVRGPGALLILTGSNSITDLTFSDAEEYESIDQTRPIIQVGEIPSTPDDHLPVEQVVITRDTFHRVGRAIVDGIRPIRQLIITHNSFESYDNSLYMSGSRTYVSQPFQLEDAVVRWNRFLPGSFARGAIASQLGASRRVDFSSNVAEGTAAEGLHESSDLPGWAAGFFWNALGNQEDLLVAENQIYCPGDKGGNGEAIAYDDNGNTPAFAGAQRVKAAGRDWITAPGPLLEEQFGVKVPLPTYYRQHWIQVVQGPGLGQTRRISSYRVDPQSGNVTFRVTPAWDVVPRPGQTRIDAGKQFWQVYTVANTIDQSKPRCRKANPTGPVGGQIAQWAQSADTVIAGNHQIDTSGIVLQQVYSVKAPSCPTCERVSMFQTSVEITGNEIAGEYLWDSDCSESGIMALFGASATPESPPPLVSFAISIGHNTIAHADGSRGGAIDITTSWSDGPPPHDWRLVQSPLIFHNTIRDIAGPLPAPVCRRPMAARAGIRIGEAVHVRDAVLYKNTCRNVDVPIVDDGQRAARHCISATPSECECAAR
jgi:hypothetical protein